MCLNLLEFLKKTGRREAAERTRRRKKSRKKIKI